MTASQPVGWADIATKQDLHEFERRLEYRLDMLEPRFDAFEQEMKACVERNAREMVQTMLLTSIWTLAVLTPLTFCAVALAA